jgi:alkylmercury lyase
MTDDRDRLADDLQTSLLGSDGLDQDQWLLSAVLPLLAAGKPVSAAALARATGRPDADVERALRGQVDLETDEQGRVVGYGLTLRPTPHRFEVDGQRLITWCALDTLMFPRLLGVTARVDSSCHATGTPVRLTTAPHGVSDVEPSGAVVSIVTPDAPASVRAAFCDQVHFFANAAAAAPWLAEHPGASAVPAAQAHRLAQPLAQALLDEGPGPACC